MSVPLDPTIPVRIVFLGGLGEIGRNCMVIEQGAADDPDRTMMLIDCGLMFPDANMHGIDLILPDFTYLKENAERIRAIVLTHGHEDHIGAIQYLMRDGDGIGDLRDDPLPVYGSALALGLARNRIEEAGLMPKIDMRPVHRRPADRHRVAPRRVHSRHPLGPACPCGRGAHRPGGRPALGRLQDRPDPGRRTPGRPRPDRSAREERGHPAADERLDQRRGTGLRVERDERGRRVARAVRPAARPADHHGELRQPHPPDPADRRCCGRRGTQGRNARSEHEEEHPARPRPRRVQDPRVVADRHRGHRPATTPARSASSRPDRRASRCRRSG